MLARLAILGVLLVAGTLSGCVAAPAAGGAASAPTESLDATEAATGVQGVIQGDDFAPLAGATVQVGDLAPVFTDEAGRFVVIGVPPGKNQIFAQALGYQSVGRVVTVLEGELAEVRFLLERLPVQTPYVELLIMEGYDSCSFAVPTSYGTFPPDNCPFGETVNAFVVNLTEDWQYGVFEIVWSSSESLNVCITAPDTTCGTDDPSPGFRTSASPNRLEAAPEDASVASEFAMDGKTQYPKGAAPLDVLVAYAGYLQADLNTTFGQQCATVFGAFGVDPRLGCPFGVGYSTGIRFTLYSSVFHWERPLNPKQYSGVPDG